MVLVGAGNRSWASQEHHGAVGGALVRQPVWRARGWGCGATGRVSHEAWLGLAEKGWWQCSEAPSRVMLSFRMLPRPRAGKAKSGRERDRP